MAIRLRQVYVCVPQRQEEEEACPINPAWSRDWGLLTHGLLDLVWMLHDSRRCRTLTLVHKSKGEQHLLDLVLPSPSPWGLLAVRARLDYA
jgi:hypothetical protein